MCVCAYNQGQKTGTGNWSQRYSHVQLVSAKAATSRPRSTREILLIKMCHRAKTAAVEVDAVWRCCLAGTRSQSGQRVSHSVQARTLRRLIPTGSTHTGRHTAGWPWNWPTEAPARWAATPHLRMSREMKKLEKLICELLWRIITLDSFVCVSMLLHNPEI